MSSQNENLVANFIGGAAYEQIIGGICMGLGYCASLSLFIASLRVLYQPQERPEKWKLLLAIIFFMFVMDTGLFIVNVAASLTFFKWAKDMITDNTPPLEDRLWAANLAVVQYNICAGLFEIINFIVGDAIVLWRAITLWPDSYWIRGGLYLVFLGDIGIGVYDLVIFGTSGLPSGGQTTWWFTDSARILVSMLVNLLATLFIGVKAWHFRSDLRLALSKSTKRSFVYQVLKCLIESGVIFCALQLLYALFNLIVAPIADESADMTAISLFDEVMSALFPIIAGMYPPFVILIMAKHRSIWGTASFVACEEDSPAEPNWQQARILSTLQFASAQESIDQPSSHSQTISTSGSFIQPSKDGVLHVVVSSEAGKAV